MNEFKVTKIGHCCLILEYKEIRIMTDPGNFSTGQNEVENIDYILITHEHEDHCHTQSVQKIIGNNPDIKIITNKYVGEILNKLKIEFQEVKNGETISIDSIQTHIYEGNHALIADTYPQMRVTAFLLENIFYYAGDMFHLPNKEVKILAMPVEAPWMKLQEGIDFAKAIKPQYAFPVHDARLNQERIGSSHKLPEMILEKENITFVPMKEGNEHTFIV